MSKFAFYVTLPPFMFLKITASDPAAIELGIYLAV